MNITKSKLLQIIKEETENVLLEQEVINLPPLTIPRPEGYPTEEDLNYLTSLGTDEEMSVPQDMPRPQLPYIRPAVSPGEALSLKQLGMDPRDRDSVYDPTYNPASRKPFRRGERETYVPARTRLTQQYPYRIPEFDQEDIEAYNEREMERVAMIADQDIYAPGFSGQEMDWESPELFDRDLPPDPPSARGELPETGGVFVRGSRGREYGIPQMKELVDSLKDIGGGGWYIGDLSQEGGGDIVGHKSHESGVDADISLPTIDGSGMSTQPGVKGPWKFRDIRPNQMDYDKTVEFLRKTGPRASAVLLDPMFFPGIKAKMDELLASGDMSPREYRRISGVSPGRSWARISGNNWGAGLLKSQPDRYHKNHFHLRLRGGYERYDTRARGKTDSRMARSRRHGEQG